ncbi:hypothetical protein IP88_11695, partial [alpha proteobacterium AAP81b]
MTEHDIVRRLLRRIGSGVAATAAPAIATLSWAETHGAWLLPARDPETPLDWPALLAAARAAPADAEAEPPVLVAARELAALLGLSDFDTALLALIAASDRLPRVAGLFGIAATHGHDLPVLLGGLIDDDPAPGQRVRAAQVFKLGLAGFRAGSDGTTVEVHWPFARLLDRGPLGPAATLDLLIGARQPASLGLDAFEHVADAGFIASLLRGALAERAAGINILLHGPPGTGKTELARTLAASIGAALHSVGEADDDGDEPQRWERLGALRLAQRLLAPRGGTLLLFDEMEDLIGDAAPTGGGWMARRAGSKVFVNRLIETNPVPVIWTTNTIGNLDPAILRRMSFVLKLDYPSRRAAQRMLATVTAAEGGAADTGLEALLEAAPDAAAVLRVATR